MFDPTQSLTKVSTVKPVYKKLIEFLLPLGWDASNNNNNNNNNIIIINIYITQIPCEYDQMHVTNK